MPLRSFSLAVIIRVIFLMMTILLLATVFGRSDLFFNQLILGLLVVIQLLALLRYVNRTNRELAKLLLSLKHADFAVHFPSSPGDTAFKELYQSFREIITSYKAVRTEREEQSQYLSLLVAHIQTGIISLKGEEEISLMNQAALDMLQISRFYHWKNLRQARPAFVDEVQAIREGERRLMEVMVNQERKKLSVFVSAIVLLQQPYKIITFQDIGQEIDRSEVDAWHKLIRILSHEMMNSVTPIASLSETMLQRMQYEDGRPKKKQDIPEHLLSDLMYSLQTIQRRSDGLLHFLDNYRQLTRVPLPNREAFAISALFDSVNRLMRGELQQHRIGLRMQVVPEQLMLVADFTQIEQVLINLITNSVQALQQTTAPRIWLRAYDQGNHTILEVTDNGCGIDDDKLDQIFVPFFSTKEQGSGIGLSLSRYIMSLHGGNISVQSEAGRQTSFYLFFQNFT